MMAQNTSASPGTKSQIPKTKASTLQKAPMPSVKGQIDVPGNHGSERRLVTLLGIVGKQLKVVHAIHPNIAASPKIGQK